MLKKLQVPATIFALLLVVVGMNTIADMRQQRADEQAKQIEIIRNTAEAKALAAKGEQEAAAADKPAQVFFELPPNSGPQNAPVKLEIFVNNGNSCHSVNKGLAEIHQVYGDLLRVEWLSMTDPNITKRSDDLSIGCEAGLVINGKIEMEITRDGGKALVSFRGLAGDKYKVPDVYAAINTVLVDKGHAPPAEAVAKAKS